MKVPATADLCDEFESWLDDGRLQVLAPGWLCLGQRIAFSGRAATLRLFEDNSLLAVAVKTPGEGRVLVVDAGGSLRCAVFGGNLASAAASNGWAGLVIHGCARDADEIDACDIGVRVLGLNPRRPVKRGVGEADVAVRLAGALVRPGDWVYADRDGVLVAQSALHQQPA